MPSYENGSEIVNKSVPEWAERTLAERSPSVQLPTAPSLPSNFLDSTSDLSDKIIDQINSGVNPPPAISHKVFIPDWNNRPPIVEDVLSLGGTPILGHQNTASIIANPGAGKSSVVEAIGASVLNPSADCLGFHVAPSCRGVIIVDNERTNSDVWNGRSRMARRAKIREGEDMPKVIIAGMRSVARLEERRAAIESLLENYPCSLLLLDGAGDLVYDTNDLNQVIECRIWMRELTVKYDLSILSTLHPNPNSEKPRGHQGSEICREAESVLIIKPYENAKIITSDFEHGKNRNNPKLTTAFTWSEEQMMFISTEVADKSEAKNKSLRLDMEKVATKVLAGQKSLSYTELVDGIMQLTSLSEPTAGRRVRDMAGWGIIKKHDDGKYRMIL